MSTRSYDDCLPGSWLAARLAYDPFLIEAMRRDGELIAIRRPSSTEWLYPAWQFDGNAPRHGIERIVRAARQAGLDEDRLYTVMTAPLGLGGDKRVYEIWLEGRDDDVVELVRAG